VATQYRFTCQVCGERTVVDESVREALVEQGCFVCGAPPSSAAFATTDG
jgi:transcription elongation factor Elf1